MVSIRGAGSNPHTAAEGMIELLPEATTTSDIRVRVGLSRGQGAGTHAIQKQNSWHKPL